MPALGLKPSLKLTLRLRVPAQTRVMLMLKVSTIDLRAVHFSSGWNWPHHSTSDGAIGPDEDTERDTDSDSHQQGLGSLSP